MIPEEEFKKLKKKRSTRASGDDPKARLFERNMLVFYPRKRG